MGKCQIPFPFNFKRFTVNENKENIFNDINETEIKNLAIRYFLQTPKEVERSNIQRKRIFFSDKWVTSLLLEQIKS